MKPRGEFCAIELDDGSLGLSYALLDDTLERMLALGERARWIALIGPSMGCMPDALFARGVTLLSGTGSPIAGPESTIAARRGARRPGAEGGDHAGGFSRFRSAARAQLR